MVPMLAERGLLFIALRMKRYFIKLLLVIKHEHKFPSFIEIEEACYYFCCDLL